MNPSIGSGSDVSLDLSGGAGIRSEKACDGGDGNSMDETRKVSDRDRALESAASRIGLGKVGHDGIADRKSLDDAGEP